MSAKIHILSKIGTTITVAFYYEVTDAEYEDSANDQARVPASSRLSSDDVQKVKDGRIFEFVKDFDVKGKKRGQILSQLATVYTNRRDDAIKKYHNQFRTYVGLSFDGEDWS